MQVLKGKVEIGVPRLCLFSCSCTWILPCADSHFVRIMYEGAACATVTLAEAVVIHAVLLLLLFLTSVSDDGNAPLDCTTGDGQSTTIHNKHWVWGKTGNFSAEFLFQLWTIWVFLGKGVLHILILKDYFWTHGPELMAMKGT